MRSAGGVSHDGPSAGATSGPVAAGLWYLLALALAMMALACAGFVNASSSRAHASLIAPSDVAAPDAAKAAPSALARRPAHQCRDAVRRVADLKVVEVEIEEEDGDPRYDVTDAAPVAVSGAFPRKPRRALRAAPQVDTSCFAIDSRLPRGPPV